MLLLYSHFLKSLCLQLANFLQQIFCILYVWSSVHNIGISLFAGRKCVDLVVVFNKGREETFAVFLQNCKSWVCIKYLTLFRPLHSMENAFNSSIAIKLFISQFFTKIKLCLCFFSKKYFSPFLCHVYVCAIALTWTVHLTSLRVYWSFSRDTIGLGF